MLSRPRTLPAGFIQPCLPMKAPKPPSGALWLHEIKHDGFRVIAREAAPAITQSAIAASSNDVIVGGKNIGTDPDANVRYQMRRDVGSEGGY